VLRSQRNREIGGVARAAIAETGDRRMAAVAGNIRAEAVGSDVGRLESVVEENPRVGGGIGHAITETRRTAVTVGRGEARGKTIRQQHHRAVHAVADGEAQLGQRGVAVTGERPEIDVHRLTGEGRRRAGIRKRWIFHCDDS